MSNTQEKGPSRNNKTSEDPFEPLLRSSERIENYRLHQKVPATSKLREKLLSQMTDALWKSQNTVIRAPTSSGKTYTVATYPWNQNESLRGGRPVVHLHPTTEARNDAHKNSTQAGLNSRLLRGREDSLILKGQFDDRHIAGQPVSEWIKRYCDKYGYTFAEAKVAAERELGKDAPWRDTKDVISGQWADLFSHSDTTVDILHATHQFAYSDILREGAVLIFDEQPDFTKNLLSDQPGLGQDTIRSSVTAYLNEVNASTTDFEELLTVCRHEKYQTANWCEDMETALLEKPGADWYRETENAHRHSRAFTRAIFYATEESNGRRVGTVSSTPPTLIGDSGVAMDETQVTLVFDSDNNITAVRTVPNFDSARVVIGLDAYPVLPLWELNTGVEMEKTCLLPLTSRRLWRRFQRNLYVIQVGQESRFHTRGGLNESKFRCLIRALWRRHGSDFRSCICAKAVEPKVKEIMEDEGIDDPLTMVYGEQNSRNDFADETVGLVVGCNDMGDENVLDRVAELGGEANAKRSEEDCPECHGNGCTDCAETGKKRASGRGFEGPEGDTAERITDSVWKTNVAQGVGRFARNPDELYDGATVYVWTSALTERRLLPHMMVDEKVNGVWNFKDGQQEVVDYARSQRQVTAHEVEQNTNFGKDHARQTLNRLVKRGRATVDEGEGAYGRNIYHVDSDIPKNGVVDLGP